MSPSFIMIIYLEMVRSFLFQDTTSPSHNATKYGYHQSQLINFGCWLVSEFSKLFSQFFGKIHQNIGIIYVHQPQKKLHLYLFCRYYHPTNEQYCWEIMWATSINITINDGTCPKTNKLCMDKGDIPGHLDGNLILRFLIP